MNTNRRRFLQSSCIAGGAFSLWSQTAKGAGTFGATASQLDEAAAQPVLKTEHFSSPVKIASVDLLQLLQNMQMKKIIFYANYF